MCNIGSVYCSGCLCCKNLHMRHFVQTCQSGSFGHATVIGTIDLHPGMGIGHGFLLEKKCPPPPKIKLSAQIRM